MRDGHPAAEHRISFDGPRDRKSPEFQALRETLLADLGVAGELATFVIA
jgi:hypothetical protein